MYIYSDSNGAPLNLLYSTGDISGATTGKKTAVISGGLNAGTMYWLGTRISGGSSGAIYNQAQSNPICIGHEPAGVPGRSGDDYFCYDKVILDSSYPPSVFIPGTTANIATYEKAIAWTFTIN